MTQQQSNETNAGSEGSVGKIAQELLHNQVVTNAIQGVMGAGEKLSQAQEAALGALNLPSASDLDKLIRRVRSLSQRLESVEDGIDRLEGTITKFGSNDFIKRLEDLELRLEGLAKDLTSQVNG